MAGNGHEDIDKIAALIKRISAKYTILMVEHNLNVVATFRHHYRADPGHVLAERPLRRSVQGCTRQGSLSGAGHA